MNLHGWWIVPMAALGGLFICFALAVPYIIRDGVGAAITLAAVFVVVVFGALVAVRMRL